MEAASPEEASSSGDWLGYSGGLTDIGVSSWAARASTLS